MASNSWVKRHYTLIIVPQATAKFRKFKLPYWAMIMAAIFSVLIVGGAGWAAHRYDKMSSKAKTLEEVAEINDELQRKNAQYKVLTEEITNKLAAVDQKARNLAAMLDVPQVEAPGIGDIDRSKLYNDVNLDRRLPLGSLRVQEIDTLLSNASVKVLAHTELLDHTPSITPMHPTVGHITSRFGNRKDPFTKKPAFHSGLDFGGPLGTPIRATANGIISEVKSTNYGLGKVIVIDHLYGYETSYGHLDDFNVKRGQSVKRGDIIGQMGNTGRSTNPHLHYEVHKNGDVKNPQRFIIDYPNSKSIPSFAIGTHLLDEDEAAN